MYYTNNVTELASIFFIEHNMYEKEQNITKPE